MRKNKYLLLLVLSLVILSGCVKTDEATPEPEPTPTAFDELWSEAPENTLAVLINTPSEEQLANYSASEKLVLEETEEHFLLIPSAEVSSIIIHEMEFIEDQFQPKYAVYENRTLSKDFVLDLTAMRPEGGPHFLLTLRGANADVEYYITYDGKDGTPNIEYIEAK